MKMSFKECLKPNLRSKLQNSDLNRIYVMHLDSSAKTESSSHFCTDDGHQQAVEH